ncbi:MAG: NAD(P)/FAD-dependent oxidoreductase [Promethearchaeota archaeon]
MGAGPVGLAAAIYTSRANLSALVVDESATCDGDFYRGKDIVVVGGGNSAMEESLLLLKLVKSITFVHQFDELQAEKITADKVLAHDNVEVLWSHETRSFRKNAGGVVVEVENLKTGERFDLERAGVFIFVGMVPNSDFLEGTPVEVNEKGYVPMDELMHTNVEGVFAVGDIRVKKYAQITVAVSDGTIAALEIVNRS